MSTTFSLLVTGSPTESQAHLSALRFIESATKLGHQINNVFFYQEAVAVANRFILKPADEAQLTHRWQTLAANFNFELGVCVAAATRRGIIDTDEAQQQQLDSHSVAAGFEILGLGQFASVLAGKKCKLVQFK